MTITTTVSFNDPTFAFSAFYADLTRTVTGAANLWGQHLASNAKLDIQVSFADLPANTVAQSGSLQFPLLGKVNGVNYFEPGAVYELLTGSDPNGTSPDINVTVD